jgi:hypothetical protein
MLSKLNSLLRHASQPKFHKSTKDELFSIDLTDKVNHPGDITFFIPTVIALAHEKRLVDCKENYGIISLFLFSEDIVKKPVKYTKLIRAFKKNDIPSSENTFFINFGNSEEYSIARWIFDMFDLTMSFDDAVSQASKNFYKKNISNYSNIINEFELPKKYILLSLETMSGKRLGKFGAYPSEKAQADWMNFIYKKLMHSNLPVIVTGTGNQLPFDLSGLEYFDIRCKTSIDQLARMIVCEGCELVFSRDNLASHLCGIIKPNSLTMFPRSFLTKMEYKWIERRFFNVFK